mgnify:CR=1 FL=1
MTQRQEGLILILVMLVMSFVFQLQMKVFATEITQILTVAGQGTVDKLTALVRSHLWGRAAIIGLLACSLFLVWLMALMRLELSLALPLASIALVINAVGSGLLLGEALSLTRVVGIMVVASGLTLVLWS